MDVDGEGEGFSDDEASPAEGEEGGSMGPPDMASSVFVAHTKPVQAIDMHKTLPLVVTGGEDDMAYLWQYEPKEQVGGQPAVQKPVKELKGHTDTVISAKFSADGTMIATAGMDGRIMLWTSSGDHLGTMEDLGDAITYMFWHPKGNIVFAGSADSQSAMWNDKGVCLQYFTGHASEVTCGALVNQDKMLATGSDDFAVKVFAPKTGELVAHFDNRSKGMHALPGEPVTAVQAHPRVADTVIAGYESGCVAFLSIETKKVLKVVESHTSAVEGIALSALFPYFTTCCAGGEDGGNVTLWNGETNNCIVRDVIKQEAGIVQTVFVGEHLYTIDTQGEVKRYDPRGLKDGHKVLCSFCTCHAPHPPTQVFTGHANTGLCLAVHEDGFIASGSDDNTARLFHPKAATPSP